MVDLINASFAGGEATPSIWGRTDEARFHVSASVIRNCFVNFRGGISSRAGLKWVGPTWLGLALPPRKITFRFSITTDFILVFGDKKMRVEFDGAYVTQAPISISAVSQTNPIIISTGIPNNLTEGALVYLIGLNVLPLNGRFFFVTNVSDNQFTISDIFGNPVDGTQLAAYTGGGTMAQVYEIDSPYAIEDLPYLKFTQSADVMSLCCVNTETLTEYPPYDLERFSDTDWEFVETTFQVSIAAPASCTATPSTITPTPLTGYAYVVTAVSSLTGEESQASPVAYCQSVDIASTLGSITIYWPQVANAAYYNIYKAPPAYSTVVPIGSQFGYAGSSFGTSFVDTNITQDFTTTPPIHLNPFARGQILNVVVTAPGAGLLQSTITYSIASAKGTGFVGFPVIVNGQLTGFYIQNTGMNYQNGDPITFLGSLGATGTYTFTANPTNTQTIVLNGINWTFVTSGATVGQTNIQGTVQATIQQLAADLNASTSASLNVAGYSASGLVLTISYLTGGTAGNSYTLAAGTYGGTVSGATLTGGAASGSGGAAATLKVGPEKGTYPAMVNYDQQRRFYGNTLNNPDTGYASQTGAYNNFDSSSPPIDSDAITFSPWAQQVNGLQWYQPMPGGLIVATGLDAWQLSGTAGAGSPITPAQISAQPQGSNGFDALLPPIKVNYDVIYFFRTTVWDLEYNFFVNIYAGNDISLYSNHLFQEYGLVQWAWAKEPYKLIWAVRNDGKLLSLAYVKEQKVAGWSRHDTLGAFCSVTTASEPPIDATYFVTQRYIPGPGEFTYYSERMDNRQWQGPEDPFCVDCGLELAQPTPDATLSASSAAGIGTLVNPLVISGGSNYSLTPAVTVTDPSQPGVSVTGTATTYHGVITGWTVSGAGFKNAKVTVTDNTGSGAVLSIGLQNLSTFTASASVFTAANVGQVIRMGGGIATIQTYVNPTTLIAEINSPIVLTVPNDPTNTPVVAQIGAWSITQPVTTLYNLDYLEGFTVNALADGNVVMGLTVKNGSVTLPVAASNIKIGLPFIAQLQALHTDIQGGPTVQGKPKRISGVTVRMEKSRGLKIGANQPIASALDFQQEIPWGGMVALQPLQDRTTMMTYGQAIPLFTGDKYLPISDIWRVQLNQQSYGMVAMQQDQPLPANVLAFIYSVEAAMS